MVADADVVGVGIVDLEVVGDADAGGGECERIDVNGSAVGGQQCCGVEVLWRDPAPCFFVPTGGGPARVSGLGGASSGAEDRRGHLIPVDRPS